LFSNISPVAIFYDARFYNGFSIPLLDGQAEILAL
jgi:hypothetical protein